MKPVPHFRVWLTAFAMFCSSCLALPAENLQSTNLGERSVTTSKLLAAFRTETVFWKQIEIGKQLAALNDKSVIPAMVEIAKSPDRRIRCNAGYVLAKLGDERGLATVLAELRDKSPERKVEEIRSDGKPNVAGQISSDRYYAAHVLGEIGDTRAVPALIAMVQDNDLTGQAAYILGKLGDKGALPTLREALQRSGTRLLDGYPTDQFMLSCGLASLGDAGGFSLLLRFLKDGESWVQRRGAAEYLGDLGDRRAVPALIVSLKDQEINVRVSAARALGKIGDATSIPALTGSLGDDTQTTSWKPTTMKQTAAESIRQIRQAKH